MWLWLVVRWLKYWWCQCVWRYVNEIWLHNKFFLTTPTRVHDGGSWEPKIGPNAMFTHAGLMRPTIIYNSGSWSQTIFKIMQFTVWQDRQGPTIVDHGVVNMLMLRYCDLWKPKTLFMIYKFGSRTHETAWRRKYEFFGFKTMNDLNMAKSWFIGSRTLKDFNISFWKILNWKLESSYLRISEIFSHFPNWF